MIPLLLCCGAFAIVFISAQMGARSGALLALGGMLGTLLGMSVALRYWFLASQWIGQLDSAWSPWHSVIVFWVLFILVVFISFKLRQNYTEVFESVYASFVDRILGGAFGLVSGVVVVTALMMTLTIASPTLWPAYKPDQLPFPIDRWPLQTYRYIEVRLATIPATDPGHTPLPAFPAKVSDKPTDFWH